MGEDRVSAFSCSPPPGHVPMTPIERWKFWKPIDRVAWKRSRGSHDVAMGLGSGHLTNKHGHLFSSRWRRARGIA